MNQLSQKKTELIRNAGFLLNGIGIGIVFSGSAWLQNSNHHELFMIGLWIIVGGNFLRSAKTKEEKENELQKKSDRYARMAERIGPSRIKLVFKASVLFTVVVFAIAMAVMISGSMNSVWPLIGLITVGLVTASLTHEPDPIGRDEQRQDRAHS